MKVPSSVGGNTLWRAAGGGREGGGPWGTWRERERALLCLCRFNHIINLTQECSNVVVHAWNRHFASHEYIVQILTSSLPDHTHLSGRDPAQKENVLQHGAGGRRKEGGVVRVSFLLAH